MTIEGSTIVAARSNRRSPGTAGAETSAHRPVNEIL